MFKKIVVGLDGSDASKTALRVACEIAKKFGSELYLVHTPQPQTVAFALGAVAGYAAVATMPSDEDVADAANRVISAGVKIVEDEGQTVAETHVDRGDPVEEIVACAEECGADLIVTGRRGLGTMGALVQGSTSLGVSHRAKCAFLSVV